MTVTPTTDARLATIEGFIRSSRKRMHLLRGSELRSEAAHLARLLDQHSEVLRLRAFEIAARNFDAP